MLCVLPFLPSALPAPFLRVRGSRPLCSLASLGLSARLLFLSLSSLPSSHLDDEIDCKEEEEEEEEEKDV